MRLLADAGLNAYRFGIEWARIEPVPGAFSRAELAHYRRMIDTALELGLTPVVTLNHFTAAAVVRRRGRLARGAGALDRFARYVKRRPTILDDVPWVATINEPNMLGDDGHAAGASCRRAGGVAEPDRRERRATGRDQG